MVVNSQVVGIGEQLSFDSTVRLWDKSRVAPADRTAVGGNFLARRDMRRKADHVLADVICGGKHDRFLVQRSAVETVRASSNVATCSASRALIPRLAPGRRLGPSAMRTDCRSPNRQDFPPRASLGAGTGQA